MASKVDEIAGKIAKGELSFHKVGDLSPAEAVAARRAAAEKIGGTKLENVSKFSIDVERASCRNCENMIGAAQIPLGVAGPLRVEGSYAKGEFLLPMATTEGALVASVSRGAKAVNQSGGAKVVILNDKMTRAPVFKVPSAEKAVEFIDWISNNLEEIRKEAEANSRFLKIETIKPYFVGRNVFLRFECFTGDAMGMNMVTIGVGQACEFIQEKLPWAQLISVTGNMCTDKKPSALNFVEGRGKSLIAECLLKKNVIEKILKTSPEKLVDVNYRKNLLGSAQAGSYGFNSHYANMIAAMFIACGQDPAHVVGGSMGITTAELEGEDLYFSVTIPNLNVGSVGGGTGLGTQSECLEMVGCTNKAPAGDNSKKLAEVISACVLAGELSALSALSSGQLAKAHKTLGRGKN